MIVIGIMALVLMAYIAGTLNQIYAGLVAINENIKSLRKLVLQIQDDAKTINDSKSKTGPIFDK